MTFPGTTTEPVAFLLGCERSGSTWLANIIDAHEGVELLMEPFAPYASIFPGFPHRHAHVENSTPALEQSVREGLRTTLSMKYPLFYRPGRAVGLRTIDGSLFRTGRRAFQRLRLNVPPALSRWELLNLNQSEIPADLRARKHWPPERFVVKELRLNLKVPVLAGAFPGARYVVIVRHPAAQITSTRKWLDQGRLQELAGALKTLAAEIKQSPDLERYRPWLESGDRDDLLVVWWFLNYETVLADLRRVNAAALLVRHEELAAAPAAGTRAILDFLGLGASRSVTTYVERTSNAEQRSDSPLDTFRKSAEHSRETIRAADRTLVDRLRRVANELPVCDELRGYFVES